MKTVTQLLKEYGYINPYISSNPEKTERGTNIHEQISSLIVEKSTKMDLTSENIYNYQKETLYAIKFLNDFNIVPIYVEKRINWTYSGKPDIVGTIEDKFVIIDWKTGGKQKHWGLQLWGYYYLLKTYDIEATKLYTVIIQEDKYIVDNWINDLEAKSKWEEIMTKEGLWKIKK